MNATSPASMSAQLAPELLRDLLHSLSQPLTSLLCSLELSLPLSPSLDVGAETAAEIPGALEYAEEVIGMIQLMREYLDAEEPPKGACSTAFAPVLRGVIDDLSSIAAARGIALRLVGTCSAMVPAAESRLRLALQYLITAMLEPRPSRLTLLLGEGPEGAVLRVEGERLRGLDISGNDIKTNDISHSDIRRNDFSLDNNTRAPALPELLPHPGKFEPAKATPADTLRRTRLAIAGRVLASAGASLVLGEADAGKTAPGFVLRLPRRASFCAAPPPDSSPIDKWRAASSSSD